MSNALAVEARSTISSFLKAWTEKGLLSYKFSVHENALEPTRVRVTFSKPTAAAPAAAAVAHLYFRLDQSLRVVQSFTVESETHVHSLQDLRFDESILDHVLRRKRILQEQKLIRRSDEFSSTRVPALIKERANEARNHDREALEEYLLERFQRKDPYNDGRISLQECKDVVFTLEFPTISRRDREILFAFVELDREEMVDYGSIVAIGAEMVDTLLHSGRVDEAKGGAEAKAEEKEKDQLDAVECFHMISRYHQLTTMDRLAHVLDAFRPQPPSPPPVNEEPSENDHDVSGEVIDEAKRSEEAEDSDAPGDPSGLTSRSSTAPAPPVELVVSRRQLRTSLESPHLLLSRAEINLVTVLAPATSTGEIACSQLNELVQHVQTLVFRFQARCLTDRLDCYLLQQFTNYERSKLTGSATHLKWRIRQKELKAVVKDMRKLLLSPFQAARVVALCETSRADPDHVVLYKECIPSVSRWLAMQVDTQQLRERAAAAQAFQLHPQDGDDPLPEEELVRQHANEAFDAFDETSSGVLSVADFHKSLWHLARALGTATTEESEDMAIVTALADPLGQGRVNFVYFQQIVYPVLRWLQYEKSVRERSHGRHNGDDEPAVSADAKQHERDLDTGNKLAVK